MNLVLGSASYNEPAKARFKREGMALLREVVRILRLPKGTYDLHYNAAGIACSGDCTLHADNFYVSFDLDCCNWILVRTCEGQKDFTGGPNRQYSFSQLAIEGAKGLASFIKHIVQEGEPL